MTNEEKEKNILYEQDIIDEMKDEIKDIENNDGEIDEEKIEEVLNNPNIFNDGEDLENNLENPEIDLQGEDKYKDQLTRTMADFENFKKRVDRDKQDMIFFLKSDILKKILPRLDDLERIINNTPEDFKNGVLYEGIVSIESKFKKDIENLGIKSFISKGENVDPDKHDVMTTIPGQVEGIICDEFEKGYMIGDRVLRHAKVVVGAG